MARESDVARPRTYLDVLDPPDSRRTPLRMAFEMNAAREISTEELKELVGTINPKWLFVLIGDRLFHKIDKDTWHEYASDR